MLECPQICWSFGRFPIKRGARGPTQPSPRARMNQPILYAIVAMVCYGLSDFIYKQAAAASIRADHFLMAQGWFFCPLVILYALATGTLITDPAAMWGSLAG